MSQIQVRNAQGQPLPLINVRLALGDRDSESAYDDRFSDLAGNTAWPNPLSSPNGYTLWVNERNVNPAYGSTSVRVQSLRDDVVITLPRAPSRLSRLVQIDRAKHRFVNERGDTVYGRGASAFLLYKRFLDGQDIQPQLAQLQGLGCNLIRVMGMFESLGGFDPRPYGDRYYDQIEAFYALCESYGIYVLWTACAATGGIFTNDAQVVTHIRRTVDRLKATQGALFSPVNEQGEHNNSINLQRVKNEIDFGWLLYDLGSYGMDKPCQPPLGKFGVLHTNRAYPANVKDGCTADHPNIKDVDIGMDEPARYGEDGSGDHHTEPWNAADAAGTAYTALFWVFHSLQGERGDVLHGNTLDCATAAMKAMVR